MVDSTWVTHQSDPDRFAFRAGFTILVSYSTQVMSSNLLLFGWHKPFLSFSRLTGGHFAYYITDLATQKILFRFERTVAFFLVHSQSINKWVSSQSVFQSPTGAVCWLQSKSHICLSAYFNVCFTLPPPTPRNSHYLFQPPPISCLNWSETDLQPRSVLTPFNTTRNTRIYLSAR